METLHVAALRVSVLCGIFLYFQVFLVYGDVTSARRAQYMLNGRRFDQTRVVCAAFFPEQKFKDGQYTLT